jgi:hypothetical protein
MSTNPLGCVTPMKPIRGVAWRRADGRQIAYRLIEQSDPAHLKVVVHTVATGQEEVVGTIDALGYMTNIPEGPTWSPDGNKIAIEGIYGIHTIDLANNDFMTWPGEASVLEVLVREHHRS